MPTVELSTIVSKVDRQAVYSLLKDMRKFPGFMRDVKRLEVIESTDNLLVTSWDVEIDGANILWKEEDSFNDKEKSLKFRMLEGDFKDYKGEWRLENVPGGTKITITGDFDWGLPVFEKFAGDVFLRKAKVHLKGMLEAIKRKLETANG